jgi:hypothetical protein
MAPRPLAWILLVLLAPAVARADDTRASAQALFDSAMRAMAEGAYDRACPALEEVVRLLPRKVGALMELGRCYEGSGKVASAWSTYRAAADAASPGDERSASASAKASNLASRVPKLTITVAPEDEALAGFVIKRDGHDVGAAMFGRPLPVDPGPHTVSATATSRIEWTLTVDVREGSSPVVVAVPALAPISTPDHAGVTTGPVAPKMPSAAKGDTPKPPAWAWVTGSVGLAALGVGVGFGVDGLLARNKLGALCGGQLSPCAGHSATEIDPLNTRKDRGLAVFIGAGGAGLLALCSGVVGLSLAASRQKPSQRPSSGGELFLVPLGLFGGAVAGRF